MAPSRRGCAISDLAGGQDWWLASDGNWYPPELHPSRRIEASVVPTGPVAPQGTTPGPVSVTPVAPTAPAYAARPAGGVPGVAGPVGVRRNAPAEATHDRWAANSRGGRRSLKGQVDSRGVFVGLASAVVLAATFLPWYTITTARVPNGSLGLVSVQTLTIFDAGYGGWRFAIPIVALAAVVCGIVDAILRGGQRGAILSFVLLRLLVLVQIGLVIAAIVAKAPHGVLAGPGVQALVTVRWPAWGALAAAVVALGGSLAAAPPKS